MAPSFWREFLGENYWLFGHAIAIHFFCESKKMLVWFFKNCPPPLKYPRNATVSQLLYTLRLTFPPISNCPPLGYLWQPCSWKIMISGTEWLFEPSSPRPPPSLSTISEQSFSQGVNYKVIGLCVTDGNTWNCDELHSYSISDDPARSPSRVSLTWPRRPAGHRRPWHIILLTVQVSYISTKTSKQRLTTSLQTSAPMGKRDIKIGL